MVSKPTQLPQWATNDVQDPISQQFNVVKPPNKKKTDGWFLGEKPNRQWWNWLHRQTYLWLQWLNQQESQSIVTDGYGVGLFPYDETMITLFATDNPNSGSPAILIAVGYKRAGVAPNMTVAFTSGGLGLGTGTITGDQPISGISGPVENVRVWGQTKQIP